MTWWEKLLLIVGVCLLMWFWILAPIGMVLGHRGCDGSTYSFVVNSIFAGCIASFAMCGASKVIRMIVES